MPFSSLPYDLLSHTLAYLPIHDLTSLATTNHSLSILVLSLLYRDLYVSPSSSNLSLVLTLAQKPPIAVYVRSFAIHIEPTTILFNSFYAALRIALANMSELTSLRLFLDPKFSSTLRPVHDSTFSNLLNVSTSLVYDHNVALCLQRANSLLELDFESCTDAPPDSPELPMGSLPRLRRFTGPVSVAEVMVPGRPVEFIRLNAGHIFETVPITLANSTAPVILFEANIDSLSVPFLLSLSQAMPHLRYVRFTSTSNGVEPPSHQFCDNIAKILTLFPALESFELWGIHFEQTQKVPDDYGHIWRAKMFCPVDDGEPHQQPPPPDLFSEDFMIYQ